MQSAFGGRSAFGTIPPAFGSGTGFGAPLPSAPAFGAPINTTSSGSNALAKAAFAPVSSESASGSIPLDTPIPAFGKPVNTFASPFVSGFLGSHTDNNVAGGFGGNVQLENRSTGSTSTKAFGNDQSQIHSAFSTTKSAFGGTIESQDTLSGLQRTKPNFNSTAINQNGLVGQTNSFPTTVSAFTTTSSSAAHELKNEQMSRASKDFGFNNKPKSTSGWPSRTNSTIRPHDRQILFLDDEEWLPDIQTQDIVADLSRSRRRPEIFECRGEEHWLEVKEDWNKERAKSIRDGFMNDPDEKVNLTDVIPLVGTCIDMCPYAERVDRAYKMEIDPLEISTDGTFGKKTAVKSFHRSAAGTESGIPSDIRPPAILVQTLAYLFSLIRVKNDIEYCHGFIRDRTRAIRKDFSVQPESLGYETIYCYERIARFHILSLHQLCQTKSFDMNMEREQLDKTLTSLFEFYNDIRARQPNAKLPNEPEFRAYSLVLDYSRPEALSTITRLPNHIRKAKIVQYAVSLYSKAQLNSGNRQRLGDSPADVVFNDTRSFFDLVYHEEVPYLLGCAATVAFRDVRNAAMRALYQGLRPNSTWNQISFVQDMLGMDSLEQTQTVVRLCKIDIKDNGSGEYMVVPTPAQRNEWTFDSKTFNVGFSGRLEQKRGFANDGSPLNLADIIIDSKYYSHVEKQLFQLKGFGFTSRLPDPALSQSRIPTLDLRSQKLLDPVHSKEINIPTRNPNVMPMFNLIYLDRKAQEYNQQAIQKTSEMSKFRDQMASVETNSPFTLDDTDPEFAVPSTSKTRTNSIFAFNTSNSNALNPRSAFVQPMANVHQSVREIQSVSHSFPSQQSAFMNISADTGSSNGSISNFKQPNAAQQPSLQQPQNTFVWGSAQVTQRPVFEQLSTTPTVSPNASVIASIFPFESGAESVNYVSEDKYSQNNTPSLFASAQNTYTNPVPSSDDSEPSKSLFDSQPAKSGFGGFLFQADSSQLSNQAPVKSENSFFSWQNAAPTKPSPLNQVINAESPIVDNDNAKPNSVSDNKYSTVFGDSKTSTFSSTPSIAVPERTIKPDHSAIPLNFSSDSLLSKNNNKTSPNSAIEIIQTNSTSYSLSTIATAEGETNSDGTNVDLKLPNGINSLSSPVDNAQNTTTKNDEDDKEPLQAQKRRQIFPTNFGETMKIEGRQRRDNLRKSLVASTDSAIENTWCPVEPPNNVSYDIAITYPPKVWAAIPLKSVFKGIVEREMATLPHSLLWRLCISCDDRTQKSNRFFYSKLKLESNTTYTSTGGFQLFCTQYGKRVTYNNVGGLVFGCSASTAEVATRKQWSSDRSSLHKRITKTLAESKYGLSVLVLAYTAPTTGTKALKIHSIEKVLALLNLPDQVISVKVCLIETLDDIEDLPSAIGEYAGTVAKSIRYALVHAPEVAGRKSPKRSLSDFDFHDLNIASSVSSNGEGSRPNKRVREHKPLSSSKTYNASPMFYNFGLPAIDRRATKHEKHKEKQDFKKTVGKTSLLRNPEGDIPENDALSVTESLAPALSGVDEALKRLNEMFKKAEEEDLDFII